MLTSQTLRVRGFAELAIALLILGFLGGMMAMNSIISTVQNRSTLKRINYEEAALTSEMASWQNFASLGSTSQTQTKDSAGRYLLSFPNDYTAELPTLGSNYNPKNYSAGSPIDLGSTKSLDYDGASTAHTIVRRVDSSNVEYLPPASGKSVYCGEMKFSSTVFHSCLVEHGGGTIPGPGCSQLPQTGNYSSWWANAQTPVDCSVDPTVGAKFAALSSQPWTTIKDQNGLQSMVSGNNYKLGQDIYLTSPYTPPGLNSASPLDSVLFDGQGYVIYTLNAASSGASSYIVAYASNSVFQNVWLKPQPPGTIGAMGIVADLYGTSCVNHVALVHSGCCGGYLIGGIGRTTALSTTVVANSWMEGTVIQQPFSMGGSLIAGIYPGNTTITRTSTCGNRSGKLNPCTTWEDMAGLIGDIRYPHTGASATTTIDQTFVFGNIYSSGCPHALYGFAVRFAPDGAPTAPSTATLTIKNSGYIGNMSSPFDSVGLIGHTVNTRIQNCFVSANIKAENNSAGLVLHSYGGLNIQNSFVQGSVTSATNSSYFNNIFGTYTPVLVGPEVGGLVGDMGDNPKLTSLASSISNSFFAGTLVGGASPFWGGGIVGTVLSNCPNGPCQISNSFVAASVSGNAGAWGWGAIAPTKTSYSTNTTSPYAPTAIAPTNSPITGSGNFWDSTLYSGGSAIGTGIPTPSFASSTFPGSSGWDFTNTWGYSRSTSKYPSFKWCNPAVDSYCP